jgi:hypothetical protein
MNKRSSLIEAVGLEGATWQEVILRADGGPGKGEESLKTALRLLTQRR